METLARLANLPGALPGACAQGLIWGLTRPCSQIRKKNRFFMKMLMECILIIIDAEGRKQK